MNKKLLAAAVAAAMIAPAAYADATLYGKFHVSVDANDIDVANTSAGDIDNYTVNSRSSRLGVKGSEDLGNGLKAIYQLELTVDVTDGTGVNAANRNTFLGLAGGFGTFLIGRHDTPAKVAFYAAGNERLGDSILDLNTSTSGLNPIGVFSEVRASNAIAYVSPNFAGFTVAAAVVPGEQSGTGVNTPAVAAVPGNAGTAAVNQDNDENGLADSYSVGLMYAGGGLMASVGYERLGDASNAIGASNDDSKMLQAGASFTFGSFSVGAQYEDTSDFGNVQNVDYTAWAVTGKASFGNNAISVVYTDSEKDTPAATALDVETQGWGVAAEHNFSKRTKVYAAYASNEIDRQNANDTDDDRFSLGMIHDF
ncbi:MAG: porin [Gammaproteobacteria bacterium]|nr:porin [Gammaproteobacteria bacterium]